MEKRFYIGCPHCGSYAVVTTRRDGFAYAYHYEWEKGVISRTCYLGKMMRRNPIDILARRVRFKHRGTVLSAPTFKKRKLQDYEML